MATAAFQPNFQPNFQQTAPVSTGWRRWLNFHLRRFTF